MPGDLQKKLKSFKPQKDFFIGIDSDGCAVDTMEIKHKECFCPQAIEFFGLHDVSEYTKEAWNFINLYSRTRGCNRFLGLIYTLDLLREREEVKSLKARIPDLSPLIEWTKKESKLGNQALADYGERNPHPVITSALNWSLAVNRCISRRMHDILPFPFVEESLQKLKEKADAVVVSSAPLEVLRREWSGNGIDKYIRILAGQEYGAKTEHIRLTACGKYDSQKILVIGDAPGDLSAARNCGVLFYPILPGREEASWKAFYEEALDRFFNGTFAGDYESGLLQEFDACLPSVPSWK
jgi:phosphoglycolate phosphatase-like HAD superfamily hydrolase